MLPCATRLLRCGTVSRAGQRAVTYDNINDASESEKIPCTGPVRTAMGYGSYSAAAERSDGYKLGVGVGSRLPQGRNPTIVVSRRAPL